MSPVRGSRPKTTRVNAVEWGIAFSEDLVLLREVDGGARLPELYELHEDLAAIQLLPEAVPALISGPEGQIAKSFSLADGFVAPPGYRLEGLRSAFHGLTSAEFVAAGAARQKVEWYRTHRYCSRCGASNDRHTRLEAMVCTKCGQLHFARLSPAVIVLIQRGQEILLGRSPQVLWSPGKPWNSVFIGRSMKKSASASPTSATSGASPIHFPVHSWSASSPTGSPAKFELTPWNSRMLVGSHRRIFLTFRIRCRSLAN
jgi:hypothetical protein